MKMMKCKHPMHHPGMHQGMHHPFPIGLVLVPATFILGTLASIWMMKRMLIAVETIALTSALDEMEDRLSDVERADIEGRIRERLFEQGRFGCCGH